MMYGWMWIAGPMMMLFMLALLVIVVVAIVWVTMRVFNRNKTNTPTMPYGSYSERPSRMYEQGYQPPSQSPETYQEGGERYHYPQPRYEQPQAQYPEEQELPGQR